MIPDITQPLEVYLNQCMTQFNEKKIAIDRASSGLEAAPIQYYQNTIAKSKLLGYTVLTIQDVVLSEFRTVITSIDKNDIYDLNKYEVISADQKNALHMHVEAIRYLQLKTSKKKDF